MYMGRSRGGIEGVDEEGYTGKGVRGIPGVDGENTHLLHPHVGRHYLVLLILETNNESYIIIIVFSKKNQLKTSNYLIV